MTDQTNKTGKAGLTQARAPRGFADRGAADIAATDAMIAAIRQSCELYGFEAVETPLSNSPTRSASSCPIRTGPTRACSRSRTMTSSG
jgi:hypothetical protein